MSDLQKQFTDKLLKKTILPFIPNWITPNQVSWVRIISTPFVFYLLWKEIYLWGAILFTLMALTDAIDGAQARTRDQVTELGKILDPIGDRGLIGAAAIVMIPRFYGWPIFITLAVLEIFHSIKAHFIKEKTKRNLNANWAGKFKMVFQSLAFIILFIGILLDGEFWVYLGGIFILISMYFLAFQPFVYREDRKYRKEKKEVSGR